MSVENLVIGVIGYGATTMAMLLALIGFMGVLLDAITDCLPSVVVSGCYGALLFGTVLAVGFLTLTDQLL